MRGTDRRYQGWQRFTNGASGFRGTLTLADPGQGTAVSWLGFNTPSMGAAPSSWLQVGLRNDGRPYLEYNAGKGVVTRYQPAVTGPAQVALMQTAKGWQASVNGKPFGLPVRLQSLPVMYAGTEWLDGSTAQMNVGGLNSFEGGKWRPFRHATPVTTQSAGQRLKPSLLAQAAAKRGR